MGQKSEGGCYEGKKAYMGSFAKTCIEYAEKFYPNSYVILSAKHGFLFLDELIPENYNVAFKDPNTKPISVGELKRQAIEKDLLKYDEIVAIAGKD